MFVKTVLAILTTASLAGGVVYYGTSTQDHGDNKVIEPATPVAIVEPETEAAIEAEPQEEIVEPAQTEAEPEVDEPLQAETSVTAPTDDSDPLVSYGMKQAEMISDVSLRDQAYLAIVKYTLRQKQYTEAVSPLLKIEQAEVRDVGRTDIAVALAKEGRPDDAFGILDMLEVEELKDEMRLRVIEATLSVAPKESE